MGLGDKRDSFIQGAIILSVAHLITRIMGALYRIPLYRLLGGEGVGLVQMAYPVYTTLLALSTIGIPLAISKMVAEHLAVKDRRGALRVFRISLSILAISGLFFSLILFFGADTFAVVVAQNPRSSLAIAAVAPAVFIVAVVSAFRGFFQGYQQMAPTAISQIIEQIVRVATMFVLAYLLLPRGLEYAAAGATFGAVTGAIIALGYLLIIFFQSRWHAQSVPQPKWSVSEGALETARRIVSLSIPISLAGLVMPLILLIDMLLVPRQLQSAGLGVTEATTLYGQLSGAAMPLVNLPSIFTVALATSLVPAISEATALGRVSQIQSRTETAVRLTMVLVLPSAAGLYVLAHQISALLYAAPEIGVSLKPLSFLVIFLGFQHTTSAVLQAMGLTTIPVKNLGLGAILKFALTWYLTPILGIQGAALSSVMGFILAALLNLFSIRSALRIRFDINSVLVKPLFCSIAMGFVAYSSYAELLQFTGSNTLSTLGAIFLSMASYGLLMMVTGGITPQDLRLIPKIGPSLANALGRFPIYRQER